MFGKFLLRMLVGAFVVTVVTAGKAPLYLLALIICTDGKGVPVAILLSIPICYFAGLLCTIWFIPFGGEKGSESEIREMEAERAKMKTKNPANVPYTAQNDFMREAIVNYISNALAKGMDPAAIRAELTRNGWADSEIDAACEIAQNRRPDIY